MAYERTVYENDTKVNAADVLNKFDQAIYDLFKEIAGETVWENKDTTAVFAAQTVSVETEKTVKAYEIQFMRANGGQFLATTGKIPIKNNADLITTGGGTARYRSATVTANGNTIKFSFTTGYNGTTANTGQCIPARILFYYA